MMRRVAVLVSVAALASLAIFNGVRPSQGTAPAVAPSSSSSVVNSITPVQSAPAIQVMDPNGGGPFTH